MVFLQQGRINFDSIRYLNVYLMTLTTVEISVKKKQVAFGRLTLKPPGSDGSMFLGEKVISKHFSIRN